MGHHRDFRDSIIPLIDRLNKYPVGLPDSDTLQRILAILFSADEASVASRFPLQEDSLRELAYEDHIPVESVVTTWESAREIVKTAGYGAIGLCYCRHKKEHLGGRCAKKAPTEEICISLGTAASFMVRRGFA